MPPVVYCSKRWPDALRLFLDIQVIPHFCVRYHHANLKLETSIGKSRKTIITWEVNVPCAWPSFVTDLLCATSACSPVLSSMPIGIPHSVCAHSTGCSHSSNEIDENSHAVPPTPTHTVALHLRWSSHHIRRGFGIDKITWADARAVTLEGELYCMCACAPKLPTPK